MTYSVTLEGTLSEGVDMFGNDVWDFTRLKAQRKVDELRQQGFVGPVMSPIQELEYGAFRDSLTDLEIKFELLEKPVRFGDGRSGSMPESMG